MRQNLDALFLINGFRNKSDCCSVMATVSRRVSAKQIRDFSAFKVIMSQDSALQRGASRLQTASANLWMFSINITSPLRTQIPLLNPTE
jgi:hypothetical protein